MNKKILSLLLCLVILFGLVGSAISVHAAGEITIRLHYHRPDGNYENWQLWAYDYEDNRLVTGTNVYDSAADAPPFAYTQGTDEVIFTIYAESGIDYIGYILRYGEWESKDVLWDQHINITGVISGTIDFYVTSGVPTQASSDIATTPSLEQFVTDGIMVLQDDVVVTSDALKPGPSQPSVVPPDEPTEPEPTEPTVPVIPPNGPLTEGETTIHAFIPKGWTTPVYLYDWISDIGDSTWPGDTMTQEDGRWFVAQIPCVSDNVIVHSDAFRTYDLAIGSGHPEVWIVIDSAPDSGECYNAQIFYEKPTVENDSDSDIPVAPDSDPYGINLFEYTQNISIVGTGLPGIEEWSPEDPNGAMASVGEDIYGKTLKLTGGTTISFRFIGNERWDNSCNLGGSHVALGNSSYLICGPNGTNMTLSVQTDCTVSFILDLSGLADCSGPAVLTVTEGDCLRTVTARVLVPSSWENPNCWAWRQLGNKVAFSEWPGMPMVQSGQWYQVEIPAWTDGLLFNSDAGQTPDIQIQPGKHVWLIVSRNLDVTVYYNDPGLSLDGIPHIEYCFSKNQTSVRVQWKCVAGADGYQIWRSTTPEDDSSFRCIKTITDGITQTYTNQGLTPGVTYYYKVRAYILNSDGSKTFTPFSDVDYMPAAVVFDQPYSNSTFRIRLRWGEISGAHGYQIWRKDANGAYHVVKTIGDRGNVLTNPSGDTTAYSNTGLTAGHCYTYKIRAFYITPEGKKVFGTYSEEVTVAVKPEATQLQVFPGTNSAKLRWEESYGASGYQIWIGESSDGAFSIAKSITSGYTTAYTKYDLQSGKTYYFKLRSYVEVNGKKTFSAFSDIVSVTIS